MQESALAELCRRYGLRLDQVLEEEPESFTARIRDDAGRELVLKRLAPDTAAGVRAGLTAWADTGITPRFVAELAPDLMLLEWVPGTSMAGLAPDETVDAVSIGHAIRRLHGAAAPAGMADVRAAFPRLTDGWGQLPEELRPLAVGLTSVLQGAGEEPGVLLHGDLVPYNVILSTGEPRFIDPLPARGVASWDLAKLAVSWRALGRPGILAALLDGYGTAPPLLAEMATWISLVYLQKNLPYAASPLRPHLLPLLEALRARPEPSVFVERCL